MGLTATLRKGRHTDSVLKFLGLDREKIHLIQRSNARHDVQISIRTIRANANTEHFPQLDWVLLALISTVWMLHPVVQNVSRSIPCIKCWIMEEFRFTSFGFEVTNVFPSTPSFLFAPGDFPLLEW